MFIGNLNDPASGLDIACFFRRCGTLQSFVPNLPKDRTEGSLLDGVCAGWSWDTILGSGVDVVLPFGGKRGSVFVSQVTLRQAEGSAISGITFLRYEPDGTPVQIGRVLPPNGQALTGDVVADLGCFADELIIRIETDYHLLQLDGLEVSGAVFDDAVLFPLPAESVTLNKKGILIEKLRGIFVPAGDKDALMAAQYFQELLAESRHVHLEFKPRRPKRISGMIVFEKTDQLGEEEFTLYTGDGGCRIEAGGLRGLLYAAYALFELMQKEVIPAVSVHDRPFMPMRGVHIGLPDREHIPFLKRLIKYLFIPMRYNMLFVEIAAGMRYDRHPEINEMWVEIKQKSDSGEWPFNFHTPMVCNGSFLEKDEVRDIFEYAEALGMETIPEIHSLSHAQFLTKAFPHIAEIPARPEQKGEINLLEDDGLDNEFYPSCYCPSNEDSYRIIFDVIDEVVEALHPKRYLHMGHDEVYRIGVCEKCRGKDPARLYADDVNRIHDYVASKGLTMMLWSDMLHTATQYKTPPAIDWIPKDIVMLDFIWYFHMNADLEERLLDHGFPVMLGNLYSSHFPRYEQRIRREGILGGEVSTWVAVTEEDFGFEGKMYDMLYTANMLWSNTYQSEARWAYDRCIFPLLRQMRPMIRDGKDPKRSYHPIRLAEAIMSRRFIDEELVELERWQIDWTYDAVSFDSVLHVVPVPSILLKKTCFEIETKIRADGLLFIHACDVPGERIPWEKPQTIGEYIICYDNGEQITLPIQYGVNVAELSRRYAAPLKPAYFRHEGYLATYFADPAAIGKTLSGEDFTMYAWEWDNPMPERRIVSVNLKTIRGSTVGIYLFALSAYWKSQG